MNSVTHQSIPPTRVSTSRRMLSTNPSMGAKAICMENTLNEKRAAVYRFSPGRSCRRLRSFDFATKAKIKRSQPSAAPTGVGSGQDLQRRAVAFDKFHRHALGLTGGQFDADEGGLGTQQRGVVAWALQLEVAGHFQALVPIDDPGRQLQLVAFISCGEIIDLVAHHGHSK